MQERQSPSTPTDPYRILLVRSGASWHLLRALTELRASQPAVQISVWTDTDIVDELQRQAPEVHLVLYSNLRTFFRTQFWQLRGQYDEAVVLLATEDENRYIKFRILSSLLGTKRFLTHDEDGKRTLGRMAVVGALWRNWKRRLRQSAHTRKALAQVVMERVMLLVRQLAAAAWFPIAVLRLFVSVAWLVLRRYIVDGRQQRSRPGSPGGV